MTTRQSRQIPVEYTWATKPAATAVDRWMQIIISDVGKDGGSLWQSNGTNWIPVGAVVLFQSASPVDMVAGSGGTPNTTEQLFTSAIALPAGLLRAGSQFRFTLGVDKSAAADTCTVRVRMGSAGTVVDAVLVSLGLAATNLNFGAQWEFQRVSATQVRKHGSGANVYNSLTNQSTTARTAAVTVGNMDSVANYVLVSGQMSTGTGEYGTLHGFTLELLP